MNKTISPLHLVHVFKGGNCFLVWQKLSSCDDHDIVSRSQVCPKNKLQMVFSVLAQCSLNIVWLLNALTKSCIWLTYFFGPNLSASKRSTIALYAVDNQLMPQWSLTFMEKFSLVSWLLQCLKSQKTQPTGASFRRSSPASRMWSSATTGATWWRATTCLSRCGT